MAAAAPFMMYAGMAMTAVDTIMTLTEDDPGQASYDAAMQAPTQPDEDLHTAEQNALLAESRAEQNERNATAAQATSQRAAREQLRRGRLAASKAAAAGAAGGAGAYGFVGFENTLDELSSVYEYNALSELFKGDNEAQGLRDNAALERYNAYNERRNGVIAYNTGMKQDAARKRQAMVDKSNYETQKRGRVVSSISSGISMGSKLSGLGSTKTPSTGGGGYYKGHTGGPR